MNKILLCNAFSLNMLMSLTSTIQTEELTVPQTVEALREGFVSGMGHSTDLVSSILGMDIPMNRVSNKIDNGESVIVAQYVGPRLPEGAVELPEGATLKFIRVTVTYG
ncbi:MAG TPA: DUF1874 domain-containing protein [Bacilli bacterium]|nr:DUF1874 domain-containing protein [Bacilli bacterium]